ncbi:hypothetical protein B0H14DRAFT_3420656 [Mycena olivaceomarginata]|nr:hypothetical protein B0H14DRAFT_3420656 [Mycena olivaceomarginata]
MSIQLAAPTHQKSNDASVAKFTHPPPYIPGPYASSPPPDTLPYLPSLAWFCLHKLAQVGPEQVSCNIGPRLNYQPDNTYDLLRALIPSLGPDLDWAGVDPRLWATLVQVYDNLPAVFRSYDIPLADIHLPLLQTVESTPQFSLVTILELPGCQELSDATIVSLKALHNLCALDASATSLSAYGLKILSGTVLWSDEDQTRKGPCGLRILRLRNCRAIDDKILPHLSPFLLLSVLDLRGTRCNSHAFFPAFQPAPSSEHPLYHPTPLRLCVDDLSRLTCDLFSSPNVFNFYINTLHHPPNTKRPVGERTHSEDVVVTFNPGSSDFVVGSSTEVPKAKKRGWRLAPPPCYGLECVGGSHSETCPRRRHLPEFHDRIAEAARPLSDFALHNHIADQELSAHATIQDTLSFYRSPAVLLPHRPFRGYAYPAEPPVPPSVKDAKLMLYRPPPPWATLKATAPNVRLPKPTRLPEVVTVPSKRKEAVMANYMEQFNEKRQKMQQESEAAAKSAVRAPETMPLSRNPFRRKVGKQDSMSETSSPSAPKDLKPISSIPPPLLGADSTKDGAPPNGRPAGTLSRRDITHDRDKLAPKIQPKSAFDWSGWGKK